METAILSVIPEGDPDLTTYLSELLRTNKPERQSNSFCFLTPKNPGKTEDHSPIQARILEELCELKEKVKMNPKDDVEWRLKLLKRFDWTDTPLIENEKEEVENILVQYHDIFARHRMNTGMNT